MQKKIAIYGAGGFGREVLMLIRQINQFTSDQWDFVGFYDDGIETGTLVNGYPVLGGIADLNQLNQPIGIVIAIGNPTTKKKIVVGLQTANVYYPILIHPSVSVNDDQQIKIGEGTIICTGTILTVNIRVGQHVILNLNCTVGHDTRIENYCSFMPAVNLSGEVLVEEGVYIGTGATVINQVIIGQNTTVGAGAVIVKSLPANCTAVGAPAKPIKFH
ncbi:acetyltransferase [Larkinella humicola]|uniref:Acetyltransferase n=1 Tax=Larkinella humicola TaxID=2607654 RepID=A0A5N1JBC0_9BACT|nr:acetyltransferase [Larkinella humicola]KAA9349705.1 acetyltransferase [Larkinella humicola]